VRRRAPAARWNSPLIELRLFAWGFTGVVVDGLCRIARCASGTLLRSFLETHSQVINRSAHVRGLRNVRSRKREKKKARIASSASASLLSSADCAEGYSDEVIMSREIKRRDIVS